MDAPGDGESLRSQLVSMWEIVDGELSELSGSDVEHIPQAKDNFHASGWRKTFRAELVARGYVRIQWFGVQFGRDKRWRLGSVALFLLRRFSPCSRACGMEISDNVNDEVLKGCGEVPSGACVSAAFSGEPAEIVPSGGARGANFCAAQAGVAASSDDVIFQEVS